MFRRLLIANRGEVAVRIIRACRELGVTAIAAHSTADRGALHVRLADERICIGPPRAEQSYQSIPAVVSAALATRADAVHPGYGFLAENGDLAEALRHSGVAFVGPRARHLRLMGDKARARRFMARAGVRVLPGTERPLDDAAEVAEVAAAIGYPVMVKAVAGGGGRGLRLVRRPGELAAAVAAARRDERPPPGGAHGDRGGDRHRPGGGEPARGGRRAARARRAGARGARPCDRVPHLRRGVRAPMRWRGAAAPRPRRARHPRRPGRGRGRDDRGALRHAGRQAGRTRAHPRRGDRAARRRARRVPHRRAADHARAAPPHRARSGLRRRRGHERVPGAVREGGGHMRGRWGAGLALVCAAGLGWAEESRPRVALDEPVFDFGTVDRGARVDHTFRVPNRGSATLRLDHVKSSCGCTVAVLSEREVPPGGEARVAVSLDTARLAGRTTKTVNVYTNDPDAPVVGLTLAGQVVADLILTPQPLYLGHLRRGEAVRREVIVSSGRPGERYVVERVEPTSPHVHARLEARTDGPGQRLVVELDRDLALGRFNEQLRLHTTSPREPILTLPVFGSVEGDVVVLPPQVTFGVTRGGATPERELYIRNRGQRPVTVTRVTVPDEVVTYTLAAVQEGQEYRLTLRLRDGLKPGKVESKVEIFTDHPEEKRLVIPLYAIVRDGRRG